MDERWKERGMADLEACKRLWPWVFINQTQSDQKLDHQSDH